ncbi:hypothetical protein J6590_082008 [Homalodisca vitripennis]|nr:hypothetical protein J6590_082008 [Homalodisca vitripennis]
MESDTGFSVPAPAPGPQHDDTLLLRLRTPHPMLPPDSLTCRPSIIRLFDYLFTPLMRIPPHLDIRPPNGPFLLPVLSSFVRRPDLFRFNY